MPSLLFDLSALRNAIDNHSVILTPNSRLSRKINEAYNAEQIAQGASRWTPLPVFAVNHWVDQLWQAVMDRGQLPYRRVISDAQAKLLMQEIVKTSLNDVPLMDAEQTADSALQACKLLLLWDIDEALLQEHNHGEFDLFLHWREQFFTQLQTLNVQIFEQLLRPLATQFSDTNKAAKDIYLYAFDDIAPAYQTLFNAAANNVHYKGSPPIHGNCLRRYEFATRDDEIRAAALWSKEVLTQNPNATIGIVTPNLGQCRNLVEEVFQNVFEAHSLLPETPRYTLPFNFSAGTPLAQTPTAYTAFQLLLLSQQYIDLQTLKQLLFSPFTLFEKLTLTCRAAWIEKLSALRVSRLSVSTVQRSLEHIITKLPETDAEQAQTVLQCLQQVKETFRRLHQCSIEQWTDEFLAALTLLGWPGQRRLDSNEYQQVNQFWELFNSFRQLGLNQQKLSFSEAIQALRQLASNTHFQAQTPDSPLQILGILEGAGLHFTHCWVFGLNDAAWPVSPKPNPLLPISLQRTMGMPHASAERELLYAENLITHYRATAQTVCFSSARNDDDQIRGASPLIVDIPIDSNQQAQLETLLRKPMAKQQQFHSQTFDWYTAGNAPAITAEQRQKIRGGTTLLQWQAANPFNAFARFRLYANPVEQPIEGFPAKERGIILHQVLAQFWRTTQTQAALLALTPAQREAHITELIEQAFADTHSLKPFRLGGTLVNLEKQRQRNVVLHWLQAETQRPPFHVIGIEKSVSVTINGMPLSLQVDRIDQLEDGRLLLLDYKTGSPSRNDLLGPRPVEPQLLVYGASQLTNGDIINCDVQASDNIAGIGYALLNVKDACYEGISNGNCGIQGFKPLDALRIESAAESWQAQWQYWLQCLGDLADEHTGGHAANDYSTAKVQGRYADMEPLNRFAEQAQIRHLLAALDTTGSAPETQP